MSKKSRRKRITPDTPLTVTVSGKEFESLITRNFASTAKLFFEFVEKNLVRGKNGRINLCPDYPLEDKKYGNPAIAGIEKMVNGLKKLKEPKRLEQMHLLVMSIAALPEKVRKDSWYGKPNDLSIAIDKIFQEKFSTALMMFGWYHAHRASLKLMKELKAAKMYRRIAEKKLDETRAEGRVFEQTLLDMTNARMNETLRNAPKGTEEHELVKLYDWSTNYKVYAITLLQVELEQKIPVDRLHVAQFITDVEFRMLQDMRLRRHSLTTVKLNAEVSSLEFGRGKLQEEIQAAEESKDFHGVLIELYDKINDVECDEKVSKLFADSKDEHSENAEFCDILDKIYKAWQEKLPNLDNFTPKDLSMLKGIISTVNTTTAKSDAGKELLPRRMKYEDGKARTFISQVYNTAVALRQIYQEGKLFKIEGKPQFDNFRAEHGQYFKDLEEFIKKISKELEKEKPGDLKDIDGYREEFGQTLNDVYQDLQLIKESEQKARLNRTQRFDESRFF